MELTADNVLPYSVERGLLSSPAGARVESLTGGVSCAAFRVHPPVGEPVVVKQTLAQLKVKAAWFSDPERSNREALMLELLHRHLGSSRVPKLLLNDIENHIVAMSSAPLDATNWKADLLSGVCDRGVAEEVGRTLGEIQSIPLNEIPPPLWDKQYFRQLRIEAYVSHVATKLSWANDPLLKLIHALEEDQVCLVHADYTPKNILVSGGRAIFLDFEVGHVGNAAFDVASITNHLFLKSVFLPRHGADYHELNSAYLAGYLSTAPHRQLPRMFGRMLAALMLARVHGKSPVEYLEAQHEPIVTAAARRLLQHSDTPLEEVWPL